MCFLFLSAPATSSFTGYVLSNYSNMSPITSKIGNARLQVGRVLVYNYDQSL